MNDKQLKLDGRAYHSACALCQVCKIQLNINNYGLVNENGEFFLLCKKHYSDHYIHATESEKFKRGWQKSTWKGDAGMKYEAEERNEIADSVFLLSRYNKETNEFIFKVGNSRAESVFVDIDLTESVNIQRKNGSSLRAELMAAAQSQSEEIVFEKIEQDKDHSIELNALIQNLQEKAASDKAKGVLSPGITEERCEIAEDVYLVVKYFVKAEDYSFQIENHRETPLTIKLDFSDSVNLKVKSGFRSSTMVIHCDGIAFSEEKFVVRVEPSLPHDLAIFAIVSAREDHLFVPSESSETLDSSIPSDLPQPPLAKAKSDELLLARVDNSAKIEANQGRPASMVSVKERVSMFSKSDSKPLPPAPKRNSNDSTTIKFYGSNRVPKVEKSEN